MYRSSLTRLKLRLHVTECDVHTDKDDMEGPGTPDTELKSQETTPSQFLCRTPDFETKRALFLQQALNHGPVETT